MSDTQESRSAYQRAVYIVDGARTPFLKVRHEPGEFFASDLAVQVGRELLARHAFPPHALGEVVLGCVMPQPEEANIARLVGLRLGCGKSMPAYTVQRNCASGLQAIDCAAKDIASGRHDLVIAGGTEAMSRTPLLWSHEGVLWFSKLRQAKTLVQKARLLAQLRPQMIKPVIGLIKGLTDPYVNLSMGQTAENLAFRFQISREAMDAFSLTSHQRAAEATAHHFFSEIMPLYDTRGNVFTQDEGIRQETTLAKLHALKPYFDKPFGSVTAGNSSQITDGAALVMLASEKAVRHHQLPVLARIIDIEWAGVAPAEMGLGPVNASTALMLRHQFSLSDIDYWEINEAFAAQVLACLSAWEDESFCREQLKLPTALGRLDPNRLNIDGGAIALGHPIGATGARLVLHLAHVLNRQHAKRGIATLCIGGGQGGAILIENENVSGGIR